jgi:xylulokinase
LKAGAPGELAHDAADAWRHGVTAALAIVADELEVAAVDVAAMVPSLCAVDAGGVPISDGLLYGDGRGAGGDPAKDPSQSGELVRFLTWLTATYPDAAGFWPAQAVANCALAGTGTIDTVVAMTTLPLFDFTGWDPAVAAAAGLADTSRLPALQPGTAPIGTIASAGGALLGPGTIDAYGEQLVAGAERDGDVLVIMGSTLIVWVVVPEWVEIDGLWTVPHTVPGKVLVGGPSNAGGLFVNWARGLLSDDTAPADDFTEAAVPVWQPYLRGERVPLHDPQRRASLHDLHIGMRPSDARRGVHEASAFAIRHVLDLAGGVGRRIVATGGGVHDHAWVRAIADATGLPVDVVAVPEGAALGAAYLARVTAGFEADAGGAGRWARTAARVEPDPARRSTIDDRYRRYRELSAG